MKKKIAIFLTIFMVLSSFVISATAMEFGGGNFGEYDNFIRTYEVCANLDYNYDSYMVSEEDNFIYFEGDSKVYVFCKENTYDATSTGVNGLNEDTASDLFKEIFLDNEIIFSEEMEVEDVINTETVKINGISAFVLSGEYEKTEANYYDRPQEFEVYFIPTIENVIAFVFCGTYEGADVCDELFIDSLMATVAVNGTYFDNEELDVVYDFDNYHTFDEIIERRRYIISTEYDAYSIDDVFVELSFMFGKDASVNIKTACISLIALLILNLVIMIVYTVFKYKNKKLKKELAAINEKCSGRRAKINNHNLAISIASGGSAPQSSTQFNNGI